MVNERNQGQIPDWQRQAWLVEYQACQHDNSSAAQSYWIIFGIFMALSTAILGGLVFAIFQSETLSKTLFQKTTPADQRTQLAAFCATAAILSLFIVAIFYKLCSWLHRASFLIQLNYRRMRAIETESNMWKSWRVHLIDRFYSIKQKRNIDCDQQVEAQKEKLWTDLSKELEDECSNEIGCDLGKLRKWLESNHNVLINMCLSYISESTTLHGFPKYQARSRELMECIFCILFILWASIIIVSLIRLALVFIPNI